MKSESAGAITPSAFVPAITANASLISCALRACVDKVACLIDFTAA